MKGLRISRGERKGMKGRTREGAKGGEWVGKEKGGLDLDICPGAPSSESRHCMTVD